LWIHMRTGRNLAQPVRQLDDTCHNDRHFGAAPGKKLSALRWNTFS
jgi:hypothetical protein